MDARISRYLYVLLSGTLVAAAVVVVCVFRPAFTIGSLATEISSAHQKMLSGVHIEQFNNLSVEGLYAKASPAVVRVVVRNRDFQVVGLGSGFVVTSDGLIVTNYHVVADAFYANVQFPRGDSYLVEGLVGADSDADLALLKVNATSLPVLDLAGRVLPPVGTQVFAIGNPAGLTNTLSEGIISGHRTRDDGVSELQTTAAISPGSSGGPLLDCTAKVLGVTTRYLDRGQNLNFVVPAARVNRLLQQRGTIKTLASANVGQLTEADASTLEQVWNAIESAKYRHALTLLDKLHKEQGESLYYWYALGRIHLELGNNTSAVEVYKKAIKVNPKEPVTYFNLGLAYASSPLK
jgi:S1-C subfamily serine protease